MIKILINLLLVLVLMNFAQAEEVGGAKETKESKESNKRHYTEEEFKAAVEEEVVKKLKRLGRTTIIDFSKELMTKESDLKISELAIKKREEQLALNEKEFKRKVLSFNGDQQKILGCIDAADKKQTKRVEHMVEVISGMKPVNAAQVLSVQDADISVKILGLLEPKKVSKIFNLMDKEISARLQKQYMTMKK